MEALAADLRERAAGRVIDRADIAEISVLKTYDPPLTALRGRAITATRRYGKFLGWDDPARMTRGADGPGVTHVPARCQGWDDESTVRLAIACSTVLSRGLKHAAVLADSADAPRRSHLPRS